MVKFNGESSLFSVVVPFVSFDGVREELHSTKKLSTDKDANKKMIKLKQQTKNLQ